MNGAIGIIILAAGASTRMGTPKQLLLYHGRSLLRHTAEVAIASGCQPIVVVLGAYVEQIKPEINQLPVQIIENQHWAEGMSSSIRAGLNAAMTMEQTMEAVVLLVCDQPFISVQLIEQLVEIYHSTGKPIVASEYAETVGVPALFSNTLFSELMSLNAGEGAKQLIRNYIHNVALVCFPEGALDIDTPQDYEQVINHC